MLFIKNEINKEWSGMTAREYKDYKGLRKKNLRDNMSDLEVLLADIGKTTTREIENVHKPYGLEQNKKLAKADGEIANNTRKDIESKLGKAVITNQNSLDYQYIEEKRNLKIENKE